MKKAAFILAIIALAASCGRGEVKPVQEPRAFPRVSVPAMVTDPAQKLQYALEHFWDAFFDGSGPTDTAMVLGVSKGEFEQALSSYATLMIDAPLEVSRRAAMRMMDLLEARQAEDTTNHCYPLITGLVSKYFYDPNSPLRDEDTYLPFVERMAASVWTHPDSRHAYEFEARMCALNPRGSVAPDFAFRDARGRTHKLSEVKAQNILLFFSNPGCQACKDIEEELKAPVWMEDAIKQGRVAVVSVYIDGEIDKWKAYEPNYPRSWVSGYDPSGKLREDTIYEIRAIPSLYLLDADRKVILKDTPTQRALRYIENN